MLVSQIASDARASLAAWNRDAAVASITAAFPPTNGSASPAKVRQAIYRLGGSSGEARFQSEQEAAEWLLGRVKAWAGSKLCRTTPQAYRKACGAWMDEGMFDSADAEWERSYAGKAGAQAPSAPMRTGALERIKAQEQAIRARGAE